jgi:hypothetical protein
MTEVGVPGLGAGVRESLVLGIVILIVLSAGVGSGVEGENEND